MDPSQESQMPGIKTLVQNMELSKTPPFITPDKSRKSVPQVSPLGETFILPHLTAVYLVPRHNLCLPGSSSIVSQALMSEFSPASTFLSKSFNLCLPPNNTLH